MMRALEDAWRDGYATAAVEAERAVLGGDLYEWLRVVMDALDAGWTDAGA